MKRSVCLRGVLVLALAAALLSGPPAQALTIWGYSEGLALAQQGELDGYADPSGRIVIPVQYDTALSFSLGMTKVGRDGRLGVIRQDGRYLIEMEYGTLDPIDAGLYIAQKGPRWGLVSILPLPDGTGGGRTGLYEGRGAYHSAPVPAVPDDAGTAGALRPLPPLPGMAA